MGELLENCEGRYNSHNTTLHLAQHFNFLVLSMHLLQASVARSISSEVKTHPIPSILVFLMCINVPLRSDKFLAVVFMPSWTMSARRFSRMTCTSKATHLSKNSTESLTGICENGGCKEARIRDSWYRLAAVDRSCLSQANIPNVSPAVICIPFSKILEEEVVNRG